MGSATQYTADFHAPITQPYMLKDIWIYILGYHQFNYNMSISINTNPLLFSKLVGSLSSDDHSTFFYWFTTRT